MHEGEDFFAPARRAAAIFASTCFSTFAASLLYALPCLNVGYCASRNPSETNFRDIPIADNVPIFKFDQSYDPEVRLQQTRKFSLVDGLAYDGTVISLDATGRQITSQPSPEGSKASFEGVVSEFDEKIHFDVLGERLSVVGIFKTPYDVIVVIDGKRAKGGELKIISYPDNGTLFSLHFIKLPLQDKER